MVDNTGQRPEGTPPEGTPGNDTPPEDTPGNDTPRDEQPGNDTSDVNLVGRLLYLFVLLRRGEARVRHGSKPGPGLLQGQGRVLRLLSLHSPVAQKDLVYLLGIRSQSLGELLGKLEAQGLVRRSPNPDDKRTYVVEITEAGRRAVEDQDVHVDDPFTVLDSEERRHLAELLDRVIEVLERQFPGGLDQRLRMMRQLWFGDENDFGSGSDPWDGGRGGFGFWFGGGPGGPWFAGQHRGREGREGREDWRER